MNHRDSALNAQCTMYKLIKKNHISMMAFIESTLNSHSVEFDIWYCACMHLMDRPSNSIILPNETNMHIQYSSAYKQFV